MAVTATDDHRVVDRRRIELIEPGLPVAPIHHAGGPYALHRQGEPLDDDALTALVAQVRASVARAASSALDNLAEDLAAPIASISLRAWPPDFPEEIGKQRRVPYESRADSIMYREVLDGCARARGWAVGLYDPKDVEGRASAILGPRAELILRDPRQTLGPPWTKDHRMALAATVLFG